MVPASIVTFTSANAITQHYVNPCSSWPTSMELSAKSILATTGPAGLLGARFGLGGFGLFANRSDWLNEACLEWP